jgi:hypothetical protein
MRRTIAQATSIQAVSAEDAAARARATASGVPIEGSGIVGSCSGRLPPGFLDPWNVRGGSHGVNKIVQKMQNLVIALSIKLTFCAQ